MKHISEIIEDILVEWAYRVHDGMPNPTNPQHIIELRESMEELNLPNNVIYEVIQNLINEEGGGLSDEEKEKAKKMNLVHLGKGAYGKEGGEATHQSVDGKLVAKDGGEEPEKETKPPMKIDKNPMDKKDDKDGEEKSEKEPIKLHIRGNLDDGDNKVKNDMMKYGYKKFKKNTGKKPAPGGAGSAFNEIASGEGVVMLIENPDMSEEELAMKMYEEYKDTELGGEQKKTAGIKAGEIPDVENKKLYSKCIVSARSAKKKFERTEARVKNLQEKGKFGKVSKVQPFYGADDSKKAQVEMVNKAKTVVLPDGTIVTKKDVIAFIKAGGGGMNPSDTATFVLDENGTLMIQFHSDKTTTSDIQDNSTLAKEAQNYKDSIDRQTGMSPDRKKRAKQIVDDFAQKIQEIEEKYNNQTQPIAQRLSELPIEQQMEIIENDGGIRNNIQNAIFAKDSGNFKEKYRDYLPDGKEPEDLTTQEKYEMIQKFVKDSKGADDDVKVITKVGLGLQKKDPSIEGIDVKKLISSQRKEVVNLQRERVNKLNEEIVEIDGVEVPLGTLMEAEETIRGFHLTLMDYPPKKYEEGNPGSMVGSALDVNMGGNIVTGETLRKCTGVENTTEMKKKFKLREPEGKDKYGRDARFTYDSKELDANITGKKVFVYVVDEGGNEIEMGYKTYRSKAGATGKTNNTMTYSADMQNCFKGKS